MGGATGEERLSKRARAPSRTPPSTLLDPADIGGGGGGGGGRVTAADVCETYGPADHDQRPSRGPGRSRASPSPCHLSPTLPLIIEAAIIKYRGPVLSPADYIV